MRTRREVTAWLERHFYLRIHMFLILGGTCAAGAVATKLLYEYSIDVLALRWGIAVCVAYVVFLGLIRLWLWYVRRGGLDFSVDPIEPAVDSAVHLSDAPGGCLPDAGCDEGCGIVIVVGMLLAFVAIAGGYFLWAAPAILGEAAFEFLLAAALARSARRIESPGWIGRVWRATFWQFAAVLVLAVTVGAYVQSECPDARRLVEAWDCLR